LDKLLDAHDVPFATEEQCRIFSDITKTAPGKRCCEATRFQIDIQNGPHSTWNTSAALIFAEDYLREKGLPDEALDDVQQAFFTRVKSVKQFFNESSDRKGAKTQYGRKYGVSLLHNARRRISLIEKVSSSCSIGGLRLSSPYPNYVSMKIWFKLSVLTECRAMKKKLLTLLLGIKWWI
jgi:hypothetical protein